MTQRTNNTTHTHLHGSSAPDGEIELNDGRSDKKMRPWKLTLIDLEEASFNDIVLGELELSDRIDLESNERISRDEGVDGETEQFWLGRIWFGGGMAIP